ncbi:MAG: class I SAM-dependent methyltransferase [Corynebacterium sp.]|uniref:class I SAM-dependent methyltransferase n=1 Tax=Corynebacterium sp. TaxID=1720 RepID=UPI0026DB2B51|nr:class I SAM-dependent methyltransferase [Corynebacterium sp.]MDO5099718.1 class I SAM-dependent methyltransferase [Corynebacterium sp.]
MAYHGHNKRADFSRNSTKPIGVITRGTTGFNRLRRCDRWVFYNPELNRLLRTTPQPLAVDVGYGASHTTTCEWARWLWKANPATTVIGLEIDPERVLPPRDGVRFELGGFELAGYTPQLVRAFNVLRQYDVAQVEAAWGMVCERLAPGGFFVEGTCDEIGKRATWVLLDSTGPVSLTLAWDPWELSRPSDIAERLPKILIHRNTAGERIHDLLTLIDDCWDKASGFESFGPRIRWNEARKLIAEHIPIARSRLVQDNVLTVPWSVVAP